MGTTVTLTATATNAGTRFTGWSEDASGTANPLNLVLNTNKVVTANFGVVVPPRLTSLNVSNGVFRFSFTNASGLSFSLFAATNPSVPFSNWTLLSSPLEGPAGVYRVSDTQSASNSQRFFRVRWP
ncbi:hypothetical protein SBV1_60039 [Verrucomicrobia bacterium]|nr:hypothetical protein SBV1_60039 [Verrucomicrobiota bacterium]